MRALPTLVLGIAAALSIAVPTATANVEVPESVSDDSVASESSAADDALFGSAIELASLGALPEAELAGAELARSVTITGNSVRKLYSSGLSQSNPVVEGRARLTISSRGVRASGSWSISNRGSLSRIRTELRVFHNGRAIYSLRCSNASSCSAPTLSGRPAEVTAVSRFCADRDDDGRGVICTRSSTARLT